MDRPTLQQLVYLVALADARNFGRAAAACFVSQPALSGQIRELERRLGTTLVERLPRGIRLTGSGERIVGRSRLILAEVDTLMDEVRENRGELVGPVVLGVIPTVAPYLLGSLVPILTSRFPAAELRLRELLTAPLVAGLRDGGIDLGLCSLPVAGDHLEGVELARDPLLLAVPAGHALARGRGTVPVDALADLRVILLDEGHCLRDQVLDVCASVGAIPLDLTAASVPTLAQMVAAGVGVTLLPASAAAVEARQGNGIAVRRLSEPLARSVGFVWRATSPRIDAYEELARLTRPRLASATRT